jgi:Rod binding domain-containing protein
MEIPAVSPSLLGSAPAVSPKNADPKKIHAAAEQFEALLLTQLLQTAHPSGGWLGSGDDGPSDTAGSLAVQQLAAMMAKQGGIGLADLVVKGLDGGGTATGKTGQK